MSEEVVVRRRSKKLESSLSMRGIRSSKKLHTARSITTGGIRKSLSSKTNELSRISRGSNDHYERTFIPETFEPQPLRKPPHDDSTDFQSERFDSKYFAESLFSNKSKDEIHGVIENLEEKRQDVENVLKQQVFSNYARFIDSTERIKHLEADMSTLRHLFSEQQQIIGAMNSLSESSARFSVQLGKKIQRETNSSVEQQGKIQSSLDVFDELDCLIAERKFSTAVDLLEKEITVHEKKKGMSMFSKQIHERVTILSDLLCREIQNPSLKRSECHRIISYLIRLREPTLARNTLLDTRWEKISKQIREMRVEGELVTYIASLSKMVFSFLSSTCKEYQQTFQQPQMMSAFVVWAVEVLDLFASIFTRHVFSSQNPDNICECLEIANQHCLVLENEGLMLSFYLQRLMDKANPSTNTPG